MSAARSALAVTRNPLLGLPSAHLLAELEPAAKVALAAILGDLAADARQRANKAWKTHKGPMAVYWKSIAVYATHTKRALRQATPRSVAADFADLDARRDELERESFVAWQEGRQFEAGRQGGGK